MKRILFSALSALLLMSCLNESSYLSTYTLYATFEYSDLGEGNTFDKDSVFFNKSFVDESNQSAIGWANYVGFLTRLNDSRSACIGGFVLSSFPGKVGEGSLETPYRAADTTLVKNCYLVFYDNKDQSNMPDDHFIFTMADYGTCAPVGCYVTNTTEVVESVKEHFASGDKLILTATGYAKGLKTGQAEMVLAEYNALKDSVVTSWTKFDLTKLGTVDKIDFDVVTTKDIVPEYFCMDEFQAAISLEY